MDPGSSASLAALARTVCIVRDIDVLPKGHVRLETRFTYPDRSSIDLFIKNPMQTGGALVLSDLGQTTNWLSDLLIKPWQSKKRVRFVEDTLHVLAVQEANGALETDFTMTQESLLDAAVRLAQACVRVADLTFTKRSTTQVYAAEEIEEIISDADLEYETNVALAGRNGNVITVDFLVHGKKRTSALIALSSQSQTSAHPVANEVFRKMYDLAVPERQEQRVTVWDDRFDVYKAEDLDRIRDFSEVIALSERSALQSLLAA
jgi:hypothetical protein